MKLLMIYQREQLLQHLMTVLQKYEERLIPIFVKAVKKLPKIENFNEQIQEEEIKTLVFQIVENPVEYDDDDDATDMQECKEDNTPGPNAEKTLNLLLYSCYY